MNTRKYNSYCTKDYLMLGRCDAWNESINKDYIVDRIIKISLNNKDTKETFKKIRNYILGYKIGKLEMLFSKCEEGNVSFSFALKGFIKTNKDVVKTVSFEKGYNTFKEEAIEEAATKLLKVR